MARLMGRNLKRSRRAFSPFTHCECCPGPTPHGRAAEKRYAQDEIDEMSLVGVFTLGPDDPDHFADLDLNYEES